MTSWVHVRNFISVCISLFTVISEIITTFIIIKLNNVSIAIIIRNKHDFRSVSCPPLLKKVLNPPLDYICIDIDKQG